MKIIGEQDRIEGINLVAGIGFYDGVHLGHRSLVEQIVDTAHRRQEASAVITFRTHPRQVLNGRYRVPLISTLDEKLEALAFLGLDYCILLDFTPRLAEMSACRFLCLLHERYRVQLLFVGYDHRFGHNRREGFEDYERYGREIGLEVNRAGVFSLPDGNAVSSSDIRCLIAQGDVSSATRLLTQPYCLDGVVVSGKQLGRTIGFPTANIQLSDPDKVVPATGVYAVKVIYKNTVFNGMLNIGHRPTVDENGALTIEVHLFDFDGSLYGEKLRVCFVAFLRPERKLPGLSQLIQQLEKDKEHALNILLPQHPV